MAPALQALVADGKALPVTGQANVDLASPDLEEAYDRATGGRDENITSIWQTPARRLYHSVVPVARSADHRFQYFLDGSTKTYFIGTVLAHQRSTDGLLPT